MKQKIIIISSIVGIVLIALAFFFYSQNRIAYTSFTDQTNKVGFEKPEKWFAGSLEGYVRVSEDTQDASKPNILVKMDYPESIIPALGLDKGEEVVIGGKTMVRVDSETPVPAIGGRPASTVTYTHLLWLAPDGRKIIFEISPWQKPVINKSVERFLSTFNPL